MEKYIIVDWAGNLMFKGLEFDNFDDAWSHIEENVDNTLYELTGNDNDDNYQEYEVILKSTYNF